MKRSDDPTFGDVSLPAMALWLFVLIPLLELVTLIADAVHRARRG